MQNSWYIPYDKRVDLVLNGHDHFYERLTPVDPKGVSDPTRGIRQITEGTGAARLYKFEKAPSPLTEVRDDEAFGMRRLLLKADGYDCQFVGVPGSSFMDSSSATCH